MAKDVFLQPLLVLDNFILTGHCSGAFRHSIAEAQTMQKRGREICAVKGATEHMLLPS